MNYDERTREIATWLHGFLHRYKPPPEYDIATQKQTLDLFVNDINSRIRSPIKLDQIKSILNKIDSKIRSKQSSRIWPSNKMFIDATVEASNDLAATTTLDVPRATLDTYAITERRIKNGEPISDIYIKNSIMRQKILDNTNITTEDLKNYEVDNTYL
mgnify:CR=1 FL=1